MEDLWSNSLVISNPYSLDLLQGLGEREMFCLAESAIDYIFADDEVKEDLKAIFVSASKNLDS